MKIQYAKPDVIPVFKPITITLETDEEARMFSHMVHAVREDGAQMWQSYSQNNCVADLTTDFVFFTQILVKMLTEFQANM